MKCTQGLIQHYHLNTSNVEVNPTALLHLEIWFANLNTSNVEVNQIRFLL